MSIIEHRQEKLDLSQTIHGFSQLVGFSKLSKHVFGRHHGRFSLLQIVEWVLTSEFLGRSLYRANPSPRFTTRTVRNYLNDARINWQRLTCMVAAGLIKYLKPFIHTHRRLAFVLDDTLFTRDTAKKTELLARTFDHDNGVYKKGFRALTLAWSDGDTLIPVNSALMSSKDAKNRIGGASTNQDQRTLGGQRRAQAIRKMTDVSIELIKQALANGLTAGYVLCDSWFSSPRMFLALKRLGLDTIAMVKKSSKVHYVYRKRHYSIPALYKRLAASKYKTKADYRYACVVQAEVEQPDGSIESFPVKLVFVSNRGQSDKFLVLATTKQSLRPEEIIQLYGRRWQIEGYFKIAKQYLRLDRSQVQNYDGLCAHIAVSMMAYDILAWRQRQEADVRTLGDLFYIMNEAMPDLALTQALAWLLEELNLIQAAGTIEMSSALNNVLAQFETHLPQALATQLGIVA
jgi:hypothetical protein